MAYYQPKESINLTVEYFDVIHKLPRKEQTVLDLYYNKKIRQKELAKLFGVTQGAISHKISRIKKRLIYLSELKKIDFDKFFEDVSKIASDPFDIIALQSLVRTSCQTETAWELNNKYGLKGLKKLNQIKVKHKIGRLANRIKKVMYTKGYKDHYNIIKKIMNNLYILHEVKLPHFDRGN